MPDPLSEIESAHAVQARLLDLLEAISGALHTGVMREAAEAASLMLTHYMPHHLALESKVLLPALIVSSPVGTALSAMAPERETSGASAESALALAQALDERGEDGLYANDDALRRRLRSFLSARRYHIA